MYRVGAFRSVVGIAMTLGLLLAVLPPASARVVEMLSVATGGGQGNSDSYHGRISPDGRWVVFTSWSSNLVPGDTNGADDVFLRDRTTGTTERINVSAGGGEASGASWLGAVSPDGRYVAFDSNAPDLIAGDTNNAWDIFVRDRVADETYRVSVAGDVTWPVYS